MSNLSQNNNELDDSEWLQLEDSCSQLTNEESPLLSHVTTTLERIQNDTNIHQCHLSDITPTSQNVFSSNGLHDCHIKSLATLDEQLEQAEKSLLLLAAKAFLINKSLYQSRHELNDNQKERKNAQEILNIFNSTVSSAQIPEDQLRILQTAQLHTESFRNALTLFSVKLKYARSHHPYTNIWESLWHVRDILMPRIHQRLEKTFNSLIGSKQAFRMLRKSLLYEQRILLQFYEQEINAVDKQYIADQHIHKFKSTLIQEYCQIASKELTWDLIQYSNVWIKLGSEQTSDSTSSSLLDFAGYSAGVISGILQLDFKNTKDEVTRNQSEYRDDIEKNKIIRPENQVERANLVNLCRAKLEESNSIISNPKTIPEVQLMTGASRFTVFDTILHCCAYFIQLVDQEAEFQQETFGSNSNLSDMFVLGSKRILELFEIKIRSEDNATYNVHNTFVLLLIIRHIRVGIAQPRTNDIDSRIAFMIAVERLLQTELMKRIDTYIQSCIDSLRKLDLTRTSKESVEEWLNKFIDPIRALAHVCNDTIIQKEAADICQLIHRRGHQLDSTVISLLDTINDELEIRGETHQIRIMILLRLLSSPKTLSDAEPQTNILAQKEDSQVYHNFVTSCTNYVRIIISEYVPNYFSIPDLISTAPFHEIEIALELLSESLDCIVETIAERVQSFLHPSIDSPSTNLLIKTMFNEFYQSHEQILLKMQTHYPDKIHLLVPTSALYDKIQRHNRILTSKEST